MGHGSHKPAISVIVTVFNAEKTLERCLDSIISQSFDDFEAICINDGSTDDSLSILERYAKKDPRFHIISQDNKGVAIARQVALDAAEGSFSIHVDSDDWIEPDMFEGMLTTALQEGTDMVICDFIKEWPDRKEVFPQKPKELKADVVLGQMFFELHGSLCNKLIRNEIIRNYGIRFQEGLNCCEDQLFVMRLLACGIKISYTNKPYYHYMIIGGETSITQNWFQTPVSQKILFIANVKNLISTEEQLFFFKEYIARIAYDYTCCTKEYCSNYRSCFMDYWSLIKDSSLPSYKKCIIRLALVGIRIPRS